MNQLELILPFGIPPQAFTTDISRQLHAPSLARLVGRANSHHTQHVADFSRTLPHEILLAGHFPLKTHIPPEGTAQDCISSSPACAHAHMQTLGLNPPSGFWFHLTPVHIHVARDHLVLTDTRQLALTENDSQVLFATAESVAAEYGKQLLYGDAHHWFLRADDWSDMQTATPDAACGHNIDIWMAKGSMARRWRQLQNEIQMYWHESPLNQERTQRGQKIVNSVWLWGGSGSVIEPLAAKHDVHEFSQLKSSDAENQTVVLDQLTESVLASDWSTWLAHMQHYESDWFAPALDALQNGHIRELHLTFSDTRSLTRFVITPWSLKKFWRKPSLQPLLSCASHDTH